MQTRRPLALSSVLLAGLLATACSTDEPLRTEGNYCTEVGNRMVDLETTSFATPDDVARVLASWQAVGATSPIAVEAEWDEVLAAMQQVAVVNPNDVVALQAAADTLREAQPAADRIITYTYRVCGVAIGGVPPVTTLPLQNPPTTTTTGTAAP